MPTPLTDLLDELLHTYGPCGEEGAVRGVVRRELEPLADEVTVDTAGNLVALVHGTDRSLPPVRVMAHLDELSMVVERVEPDGTLRVNSLGVMCPGNSGLGPVAVLGRRETLTGVLTLGSEHTTPESERIWQTKPDGGDQAMDWTHVYVFTGRDADDLAAAGVHPGTRVCVHTDERGLTEVGDFPGSYFLDDREVADALVDVGRELGLDPQTAVWQSFDSDASQAEAAGLAARGAAQPAYALSTHGYEVLHSGTVERTARLLAAFLARPVPPVSG